MAQAVEAVAAGATLTAQSVEPGGHMRLAVVVLVEMLVALITARLEQVESSAVVTAVEGLEVTKMATQGLAEMAVCLAEVEVGEAQATMQIMAMGEMGPEAR